MTHLWKRKNTWRLDSKNIKFFLVLLKGQNRKEREKIIEKIGEEKFENNF